MTTPTVSSGLAGGLIAFAENRGADRLVLLEAAGLAPAAVAEADDRVPMDAYLRLVEAAKAATGEPALSLLWAEAVGMAELSVVGLVMESAATMGEAFVQLQRYGRLAMDSAGPSESPFSLSFEDGRLFMVYGRTPPAGGEDLIEAAFVRLVCGPRRFLPRPHVLAVELTRTAPPYRAEYERIFQCPVRFGAPRNAMELHPEIAGWPVSKSGGYLSTVLSRHADALLSALDARTTWRGRTEAEIVAALHEGAPGADRIAERLGFSRQTLFRRLKDENTTYEDVLDSVRERLAKGYLRDRRLGVSETAFLLGYQEPASFTRAFQRWTGRTPSDFARSAPPSDVGERGSGDQAARAATR